MCFKELQAVPSVSHKEPLGARQGCHTVSMDRVALLSVAEALKDLVEGPS